MSFEGTVNQMLPSGPTAMPPGNWSAGSANSLTTPAIDRSPIELYDVNHR